MLDGLWTWSGKKRESIVALQLGDIIIRTDKTPWTNSNAQKRFSKNVSDLVLAFQQVENPYLEESKDLIALDSKNIANQNAVDNMKKVGESGAKQFNEFFNYCLKEKETSIYEMIKKNKFAIFT